MKDYKIYKKMYLELSDSVKTALGMIDDSPERAKLMLMVAQFHCNMLYMNTDPEFRRRKKKEREECGAISTIF